MRRTHILIPAALLVAVCAGCPPKYPKCDGDKDCHAKEYCVNGQCQQCRTGDDCPAGQNCHAGRCESPTAVSQACSDDSQCPAGQSCIGGACKPCTSDSQCGDGGKCNAGRCQRAEAAGAGAGAGAAPKCALEPIYFDFNESLLTTDATESIDRNAACLKQATAPVTLTGRTDPRGTEEYNLALSDKRAQSVRERLGKLGVSNQMKTVARGEVDATGKDETGWAKDRRVDVQW
jgi:peptidoglycan-associated lipoprotein